ncbi:uncharacterized protein LOC120340778 [Styela clava]
MASSTPSQDITSNKIVVKGIPSNVSSDKLTIYFQKKKNVGGGDVQSVTFPLSNQESDTAIITFEEQETVPSVLQHTHKIAGKTVSVSPLQPRPRIFETVTAKISDYVIQQLKIKSGDVEDELESIMDSTGCNITPVGSGQGYNAEGEWYQMQAVFERIENMISQNLDNMGPKMAPESGYLSRNVFHEVPSIPLQPVVMPTPQQQQPHQPIKTQEVVSTVIDKDMFAYMKLVHSSDLDDIKKKFDVGMNENVVGDASKIVLTPTTSDGNPKKAEKSLNALHDKVSNSVAQDTTKIDSNLTKEALEGIFASLRPEFPQVHMDRVHDSPCTIIFTAPNQEKCRMALDMFKHFLDREKMMNNPNQGNSGGPTGEKDKNMISVDTDIFGYLELTRRSTLDRIWGSNGVRLDTQTIGDCLNIRLHRLSADHKFDPDSAIDEFQKLYNYAQEKTPQGTYDLKERYKSVIGSRQLTEAIRLTKSSCADVYVAEMHGSNDHVLFIAETKDKYKRAMSTFERLLSQNK